MCAGLVVALEVAELPPGDLRPYLESFFSDAMIETAYDSFLKCRNLVERSEIAFAEVHHQLADHDARMITALAERADDLSKDLATTGSGLGAMVS